ncbi:MAG: PQQ-binding-like beta-propeller repeat protein [Kiritimatiellae bacterium]|nr:PQQ-binding-like beta-propeller repeat protein [Kiritimatiellia bacterium]MDD5522314.1 PQQ-binding-like beta-propeller repeat protein [Kiritimatiellia bacterium]
MFRRIRIYFKSWFLCLWLIFCVVTVSSTVAAQSSGLSASTDLILQKGKINGGLCVQIGCDDIAIPLELARTGRFLAQILDTDATRVGRARDQIHSQGAYGLVSVDTIKSPAKLPYTENLVDLLIIRSGPALNNVLFAEVTRVLRPGGIVVLINTEGKESVLKEAGFQDVGTLQADKPCLAGCKPRPVTMGDWTHPRHSADGNTVSSDTLVGPPRRVRWVTGPERENSRLITSAGMNFYADILARDSFNGLRIWQRPLKASGPAIPVAEGGLLFVVTEKKLLALDGITGTTVREYPEAGTPRDLMVTNGVLVAVDAMSIKALDVATGKLRWKFDVSDPRSVIAGDNAVYFLKGSLLSFVRPEVVSLDLNNGQVRWQKKDYPWNPLGPGIRRMVYHRGLLVYEVSTLNNDKPGNSIHVVSADDGHLLWSREFIPSMNHVKQARAMFIDDMLWVLDHLTAMALDPKTGEVKKKFPAGLCHCFPPVATPRYMFSGEMELTDLNSGLLDANRITKANCSPDYGWIPADGLIYVCPKHCVCWPMLRGFLAMAPALPGSSIKKDVRPADFVFEKGVNTSISNISAPADEWPCYRRDSWRSGSISTPVPAQLKPLWTAKMGDWPEGTIVEDWRDNPFIRGPVTAPVVACGKVFVARPDAHQIVALDMQSGEVKWRFTANGRIDTAPTIHRGLCLFGTKSGWVYCLNAGDGQQIWRLRTAPNDERIIAYGQIESPWPVPGSVLVVDNVAYFAAGRHPLADGGILVFAVEPSSGKIRWVKRLDSLTNKHFYGTVGKHFYASNSLEFDNFNLLQQEDDSVSMSRWLFNRENGQMNSKLKDAFLLAKTGGSGVMVQRACWGYAPRHMPRHRRETPTRGLSVFRDNTLLGSLDDGRTVYRRDFHLDRAEKFDPTWLTGWAAGENANKGIGEFWLSHRLFKKATWSVPIFTEDEPKQKVAAMVLAGDRLFTVGIEGGLTVMSTTDGGVITRMPLEKPVWDGMAAAGGKLFVSTQNGDVICLGGE